MLRTIIFSFLILVGVTKKLAAQEIFDYEHRVPNEEIYDATEINFSIPYKKDSIKLSGTLLAPKTAFSKIVIIVPGSSVDTRHSHYLLAEAFLKHSIAVYRYDERGIGKSGGTYNKANYTVTAMGAEHTACHRVLKRKYTDKLIGYLGHSQGGLVTMEANVNGAIPDFMIQWGSPIQKYGAFLKYQLQTGQNLFNDVLKTDDKIQKLEWMDIAHNVVAGNAADDSFRLSKKIEKALKKAGYSDKNYERFPYLTLSSERDIVRKNFEKAYQQCAFPVLYVVGAKDTYVDPMAETALLKSYNNKNISVHIFEGLNHYLTSGKLTMRNMYNIDTAAKDYIVDWVLALSNETK